MLNEARTLKGAKLRGLDGDIGSVKDFYFDDHHWAMRSLIADRGHWLQESPSLDSDKPVSRQFDEASYGYYQWPSYWGGPHRWGHYPHIVHKRAQWKRDVPGGDVWDPRLRGPKFTRAGVDDTVLAGRLQREGTASFTASWKDLVQLLAAKRAALTQEGRGTAAMS